MHQDVRATAGPGASARPGRRRGAALFLTTALALMIASCAPPDGHPHGHHDHGRPHEAPESVAPRITDVFPEGMAESAVKFWHDNPELVPQVLEGATLLLDAAGAGASTVAIPTESAQESLVVVLTCARPAAYNISLVSTPTAEALTTSGGESCGGPTIALFSTPPIDLSSATAQIDVDVPDDTAYYLAVYRRAGEERL